MCPKSEVPNLRITDWYQSWSVRDRATQQEASFNVMGLNHPETTPTALVHGKIVFQEPGSLVPKRLETTALNNGVGTRPAALSHLGADHL